MTNIAIFASYNGSGFDAIYKAIQEKKLDLNIVLVVSNNSNAKVLSKAQNYNIACKVINDKTTNNIDKTLYELLEELQCKYIFLSGYMKKISPLISNNFKLINSHPSLLPKYGGKGMYGRAVHEAVVANKEHESGVSIHEVNEEYDSGKIILQAKLQLRAHETAETLETKIKQLEQETIVKALQKYFS